MPSLNGVTVHVVTGQEDAPSKEWGVQHIRGKKKMSAYIQAETNVSFRISIQPKVPYVVGDMSTTHDYKTNRRVRTHEKHEDRFSSSNKGDRWGCLDEKNGIYGQAEFSLVRKSKLMLYPIGRNGKGRPSGGSNESCRHGRSKFHDSRHRTVSHQSIDEPTSILSPATSTRRLPPPPFHLLASLFLDGRSKPERKVIVYLDPQNDDFKHPDGKVFIKTRWTQGMDGSLKEHAWVFRDVGIETMFDKMLIAGDMDTSVPIARNEEDAVLAAMSSVSFDIQADVTREEKSKAGQIVVEIQRIKLGNKWRDPNFQAKHEEREMDDVDPNDMGNEITHTTGYAVSVPSTYSGADAISDSRILKPTFGIQSALLHIARIEKEKVFMLRFSSFIEVKARI